MNSKKIPKKIFPKTRTFKLANTECLIRPVDVGSKHYKVLYKGKEVFCTGVIINTSLIMDKIME